MRFQLSLLLAALALPLYAHGRVTSKYVTSSDGAQIYAQAAGAKNRPHMVLIHGLSHSAAIFDELFKDTGLASKAYVVAYDLRGSGRSTMPGSIEGHASSLYAADYAAVAKAFGLVKPLFVGFSLGGAVASDILEHIVPNPLSGIVYMAAFPAIAVIPDLATPFVLGLAAGLTEQSNVTLSKSMSVDYIKGLFADPATIPFSIITAWTGGTALQSPNETVFATSRPQNTTNIIAAGKAGLPVVLLQGRSDRSVQTQKLKAFLGGWFTNFSVNWVDNGFHALFYDNRTYVENAVLKFAKTIQ